MADTQRNVHWALPISVSDFGSPFSDTSSASSVNSTSSFQYINSQLVAHGFTPSPGISLEGISNENMDRVAKCLLAMLSQRVNDMSRADELSTKLRTLSYDHERLMTMHHSATEKVLSAEREVNMYKSRLATANRSLQTAESNHKQTMAELQRTRTSLQALRLQHATELKKREKEIERMVEKWTKLSDSQAKASAPSPGMVIRGANAEVVSGSEVLGKSKGFLEVALEHAESARSELLDETTRLRRLVLVCANRLQSMLHEIRTLASIKSEEPVSFDHDALFPLSPLTAADDKMLSLFASANDAISVLAKHLSEKPATSQSASAGQSVTRDPDECQRLQAVIDNLQTELDEAKKLHETQAAENLALLNQIAAQATQNAAAELSIEHRAAERDRLDRIKKELDDERQKFTQASVKLNKEKAVFESERIKFLEEKRSWQVQQMLSPTHDPPRSPSLAAYLPEVKKSPRKSPRKQKVVGKSSNSRKTRVSRRSSLFSIPPPTNAEPPYETEVIPIVVPVSKQETKNPMGLTKSILPTSFVLPPPSPRTSLPPPPDTLLGPLENAVLDSESDFAESSTPTEPFPNPIPTIVEPPPVPVPVTKPAPTAPAPAPRTPPPMRRPFPMAKPLAPHMTHAYSPVKPSPLSRILMLAASPDSPESEPIPIPQVTSDTCEDTTLTERPAAPVPASKPSRDDDDSPLREKKTERNAVHSKTTQADPKKRTSREKTKTHVDPPMPPPTTKPKTIGAGEKENREKPSRRGSPPTTVNLGVGTGAASSKPPNPPAPSKSEAQGRGTSKVMGKVPAGRGGGARRVPIGSAEAAPLPGWRG